MNCKRKLKGNLRWAQRRNMTRGLPPPQITLAWKLEQWKRQRGYCPIFRVKMEMSGPLGVTTDKIDPKKGYTRNNTQLVTKCGNAFKGTMTMRETRLLLRKLQSSTP